MKKLFVVTRSDLPPNVRAVQLSHGGIQFQHEHPELAGSWFRNSNTLVLLEAADEGQVRALAARAALAGVAVSLVVEPDLGDAVTAVAIGPDGARLVSSLPLVFREKRTMSPPPQSAVACSAGS